MKQENHFVADLFRCLFPFMDQGEDVYVSLDGVAAKEGVKKRLFRDSTIPDLWFTLVGKTSPTLLEAKVIDSNGYIILGQSQLSRWRTRGRGAHKPVAWVTSNQRLTKFYYWSHDDFLEILDRSKSRQECVRVKLPKNKRTFSDVRELALHILRTI